LRWQPRVSMVELRRQYTLVKRRFRSLTFMIAFKILSDTSFYRISSLEIQQITKSSVYCNFSKILMYLFVSSLSPFTIPYSILVEFGVSYHFTVLPPAPWLSLKADSDIGSLGLGFGLSLVLFWNGFLPFRFFVVICCILLWVVVSLPFKVLKIEFCKFSPVYEDWEQSEWFE
jgi:hypothetical protein